jgi:hypothetical protein
MQALIQQANANAAASRTVANSRNRVMPNILRSINDNRAFLVVGHGQHTAAAGNFVVPEGKYVIFLSSPGVSLSGKLISDPKFRYNLQDKVRLARLISNPSSLGNNRPELWTNARNKIYIPGKNCPDLHLQFWDYQVISGPGQPLVQVPGQLQQFMGVWRLPFTGNRTNLHTVKTLSDVVTNGLPGVYLVYACRIVPTDVNWGNTNAVYARVGHLLPNLPTYHAYLANGVNSALKRKNYLNNVRMKLQNIGRLHLIPFPQNAAGVRRVVNVERHAHHVFIKRVGNNTNARPKRRRT